MDKKGLQRAVIDLKKYLFSLEIVHFYLSSAKSLKWREDKPLLFSSVIMCSLILLTTFYKIEIS